MAMILNSQLSWRQAFFYPVFSIIIIIIYAASVSSSSSSFSRSQISYLDHCSSIVPESPPTLRQPAAVLFPGTENGFCLGGDRILSQDSSEYSGSFSKRLALLTRNVYRTEAEGVFMVEGSLNLQSSNMYYHGEDLREEENSHSGFSSRSFWGGSVTFLLHGFWSESSGKLCMVGTASAYSREGELLDLAAALKLNNVKSMSTVTDMVDGILESLNFASDSNYFEPISMVVFPQLNYKYTMVSDIYSKSKNINFCSIVSDNWFQLEYQNDCYPSQNCTPFGGEIGHLPNYINIRASQCTEDEQRMQIKINFHKFSHVDYTQLPSPNMMLVGEGWWDAKNNLLSIVSCRILITMESLADARIEDCSIRLSLEFPASWSIRRRSRSGFIGQIWSNRTVDDSGYFNKIMLKSPESGILEIPWLKYEYTEIERAGEVCQKKNPAENNGERYPNPKESFDMQFDVVVKNSDGVMGWGSAVPLFVGDDVYDPFEYGRLVEANDRPVNISYMINFILEHGAEFGGGFRHMKVDVSAEGIYDAKTGALCMVGCRRLNSSIQIPKNHFMDCEVLLNFQFPPLGSKKEVYIRGSVESTRAKSDPLYFKSLDLSSSSSEAEKSRSGRTMEMRMITMVLISNTLACFLIGLQLLHVRKNPAILPSISLVMLVVLNFAFAIPNFEALFFGSSTNHNLWLGKGRWFKLNNLIMLAAFLLHFRLLRLALSARLSRGKHQSLSLAAEKNALYLSLPLYIAACLISFFLNCKHQNFPSSPLMTSQLHYLWRDLRYCSGLVLDWFLLPQILLNLFTNSREKALSDAFYIGTTLIRLIPHAFQIYSFFGFAGSFGESWSNADPGAGFYSAAWTAMVAWGSLLFSVVLFLQQKSGGHCILPKRFKDQKEMKMEDCVVA